VTASIGVVSFPTHARNEYDLMAKALEFMERAEQEVATRSIMAELLNFDSCCRGGACASPTSSTEFNCSVVSAQLLKEQTCSQRTKKQSVFSASSCNYNHCCSAESVDCSRSRRQNLAIQGHLAYHLQSEFRSCPRLQTEWILKTNQLCKLPGCCCQSIRPQSVFTSLTHNQVVVREQNYKYDLIDPNTILNKINWQPAKFNNLSATVRCRTERNALERTQCNHRSPEGHLGSLAGTGFANNKRHHSQSARAG